MNDYLRHLKRRAALSGGVLYAARGPSGPRADAVPGPAPAPGEAAAAAEAAPARAEIVVETSPAKASAGSSGADPGRDLREGFSRDTRPAKDNKRTVADADHM